MNRSPTSVYIGPVDLFDGTGTTLKRKHGVLLEEGRIEWVGAHQRAPRKAAAARTVPVNDGTLLPGLFDCHVHLCFDGEADMMAEAAVSEPYATIKAARNADRQLRAGVTTVRDLGGPGIVTCEVAKAIEDGRLRGPRVIASGRALTITGGHGRFGFAMEVDGADGLRLAVRQQIRAGARSIKVIATGGVVTPGISVDFTALTPEEMGAAVDEAHKWGVPIAAHAIGEQGIVNAVEAGVDSIEHGSIVSTKTAWMMKESGTYHVPTISALAGIIDNADQVPEYAVTKAKQIVDQAKESFARIVKAGVPHAVGTDAGTPFNPHGGAPEEIVRMVEWGLQPAKALLAATGNAATLCRVIDETGTVEPGKAGDLVVYKKNPLEDIEALLNPLVVLRAGVVAAAG